MAGIAFRGGVSSRAARAWRLSLTHLDSPRPALMRFPRGSSAGLTPRPPPMARDQATSLAQSQRDRPSQPFLYRAKVRGPQTTITTAAASAVMTPLTRWSKYEPWIGNNCQERFIMVWNAAAAKTLLPVLLNSHTMRTRAATVPS